MQCSAKYNFSYKLLYWMCWAEFSTLFMHVSRKTQRNSQWNLVKYWRYVTWFCCRFINYIKLCYDTCGATDSVLLCMYFMTVFICENRGVNPWEVGIVVGLKIWLFLKNLSHTFLTSVGMCVVWMKTCERSSISQRSSNLSQHPHLFTSLPNPCFLSLPFPCI